MEVLIRFGGDQECEVRRNSEVSDHAANKSRLFQAKTNFLMHVGWIEMAFI